jgi:lipopolysaccharide export system permease protein
MDRYIFRLFLTYFVAGLVVFLTIFIAIDAMSVVVKYGDAPIQLLLKYYGYYAPEVLYQLTPVACLLATLFTLSSMNRNNEIVALYSCGWSLARISASMIVAVILISVAVFFLGDRLLPNFARAKNYTYYVEIRKRPGLYSTVKTNRIWYRSKNAIFNIKTLAEQTKTAQGLSLYYFDQDWHLIQMLTAKSVHFNGPNWELHDGSVTLFTEESSFPLTSDFKTKTIVMGEDAEDLQSTAKTSDILNLEELHRFIQKNKDAGLDTTKYEVDYHGKFAYAFTGLVMTLLGIPFGVSRARAGSKMANLGVCMALVFVYWVLYNSAMTLGTYGVLQPLLAAWGPNVISLLLGIYLMRRQ